MRIRWNNFSKDNTMHRYGYVFTGKYLRLALIPFSRIFTQFDKFFFFSILFTILFSLFAKNNHPKPCIHGVNYNTGPDWLTTFCVLWINFSLLVNYPAKIKKDQKERFCEWRRSYVRKVETGISIFFFTISKYTHIYTNKNMIYTTLIKLISIPLAWEIYTLKLFFYIRCISEVSINN